jgi:6-phosphogluconolactonase (cycloisomerase 2 family)
LNFCIDNAFSPDNQFIYTIGSQAICVFEIVGKKLQLVQSFTLAPDDNGRPQVIDGRGIAVSHDGKWVFSTWQGSGTLVVCRRDQQTGRLQHIQTLKDQPHLRGVMRLAVSSDDSFVYTSSGRFNGNNAVSVFSVNDLGLLTPVQSLGPDDLPQEFDGGNEIVISPDGRDVMVACTRSDHLARFSRNPLSGKLKVKDCRQSGKKATPGAAGVAFSPDGEFVLVADEDSHSIVSFKRVR